MSIFLYYWRFHLLAFSWLLSDQLSKYLVLRYIPAGTYHNTDYELIPDFLYLVHIYNEGAAWGMLAGYGSWLALMGILAIFSIFWFRQALGLEDKTTQWCFGLIAGGIAGNVVDRLIHGHVVDFIDVHLPGYRWPAFNFADSGILIGVALYFFFSWRIAAKKEN